MARLTRAPSSYMEAMQQRKISSFLDIAGARTSGTARKFLEAARWNLEEAILLLLKSETEETEEVGDGDDDDDDTMVDSDYSDQEDLPEETSEHSLFSALFDLMFRGPFQKAIDAAKLRNKWLLVNLRARGEFNSFALNRDTWKDDTLGGIKSSFIFWQEDDCSEEGSKVRTFYKLESLPVILVIEPITGLKIRMFTSTVRPETLVEDLFDCMDSNPMDYCVNLLSRKNPSSFDHVQDQGGKELHDDEVDDVVRAGPGFPALPEEPKVDDPKLVCKVRVRLPDGRSIQRSFLRSDPIQLLWSFCCSELEEEAEKQWLFSIAFNLPRCFKRLDYSSNSTLEESGVANCMLTCTWD